MHGFRSSSPCIYRPTTKAPGPCQPPPSSPSFLLSSFSPPSASRQLSNTAWPSARVNGTPRSRSTDVPMISSKVTEDLHSAFIMRNLSLNRSGTVLVNERSYNFTCQPHVYSQVEWTIPAFTPQPAERRALWRILIFRPAEGRRLNSSHLLSCPFEVRCMVFFYGHGHIYFHPCGFFFFMVALCNRADHYIFALLFLYIFFFSSPNLSGHRLESIPYFDTWCGPSANLECMSETCSTRLAANAGNKKIAKNRQLGTIPQLCRPISSQLRHVSTVGKKNFVKQQYFLYMSSQYGELRLRSFR